MQFESKLIYFVCRLLVKSQWITHADTGYLPYKIFFLDYGVEGIITQEIKIALRDERIALNWKNL